MNPQLQFPTGSSAPDGDGGQGSGCALFDSPMLLHSTKLMVSILPP